MDGERARERTERLSTISAARIVPASPEAVFAFLADLHNHWELAGTRIELLEVGDGGDGRGADGDPWGVVAIRGPLGIRRRARTRVLELSQPTALGGMAEIAARTRARVRWELRPAPGNATWVSLSATVLGAGWVDRLLLLAGGKVWMRRVFASTLSRLAEQLTAGGTIAASPPADHGEISSERVEQRP